MAFLSALLTVKLSWRFMLTGNHQYWACLSHLTAVNGIQLIFAREEQLVSLFKGAITEKLALCSCSFQSLWTLRELLKLFKRFLGTSSWVMLFSSVVRSLSWKKEKQASLINSSVGFKISIQPGCCDSAIACLGCLSRLILNKKAIALPHMETIERCSVCTLSGCVNDGQCLPAHLPLGFQCRCGNSFTGPFCERRQERCSSGKISFHLLFLSLTELTKGQSCGIGSSCIDTVEGTSFCLCAMNSTGSSCEKGSEK